MTDISDDRVSSNFMNHIKFCAPLQLYTFQRLRDCCDHKYKKHWSYSGLLDKLIYSAPERIPSMIEEYMIDIFRNHFWGINDHDIEMGKIWDDYCNMCRI